MYLIHSFIPMGKTTLSLNIKSDNDSQMNAFIIMLTCNS